MEGVIDSEDIVTPPDEGMEVGFPSGGSDIS
jgi:hypothetical protein